MILKESENLSEGNEEAVMWKKDLHWSNVNDLQLGKGSLKVIKKVCLSLISTAKNNEVNTILK